MSGKKGRITTEQLLEQLWKALADRLRMPALNEQQTAQLHWKLRMVYFQGVIDACKLSREATGIWDPDDLPAVFTEVAVVANQLADKNRPPTVQ